MSQRGNVKEGDRVRVLVNGKLATVKETDVDRDMERPENSKRMVRLPEGDTLVLFQWKPGGGASYASGPHRYMIVSRDLLSPA